MGPSVRTKLLLLANVSLTPPNIHFYYFLLNKHTASYFASPSIHLTNYCIFLSNQRPLLHFNLLASMVFLLKAAFSCFSLSSDDSSKVADCGSTTDDHITSSTSCVKTFSWDEIKKGSKNFSKVIGSGGFSTVYLARLADYYGALTAVKIQSSCTDRLARIHDQELQVLLTLKHHPNIVNFVGHSSCDDQQQQERALLFEYASNGTLHEKLHMLSWKQRAMIAFQLATALEYIHSLHIVHGDIKASNILLDHQFNCKLCDFGSAKLGFTSMVLSPSSSKMNRMMIMGSQGYIDPHYLKTGLVSKKNDIYSYGVILLELITGREAFSMERGEKLTQIIGKVRIEDMVDPRLMKYDAFDIEEVKAMAGVAGKCIGCSPMARPSATEIVTSMRDIFTHLL